MKKRFLAILLTAAMLLGMLPMLGTVSAAEEPFVTVLQNGQRVDSISFPENGELLLTGDVSDAAADAFNWQIKVPDKDIWVDIDGYTALECPVSYALVGSMLDGSETAYLRLSAAASDKTYVSNPVAVRITEAEQAPATVEPVYAYAALAQVQAPAQTPAKGLAKSRAYAVAAASLDSEADPAAEEEPGQSGVITTHDVVVRFLYPDGTDVIQPVMAKIGDGDDLTQTIEFAPVAGYAPYFDSDQDGVLDPDDDPLELGEDGKYHFDLAILNVDRALKFHIRFRAIEVQYEVKHYFQGLDGMYTVVRTDEKTGFTNEPVPDDLTLTGSEVVGYTALEYTRMAIAADGKTVVNIYYHRNFYMVDFALGDAYGVVPVYVRYGTIVVVGQPTLPGYSFAGWDLVGLDGAAPAAEQKQTYALRPEASGLSYAVTVPAYNLTYAPRWSTGAASYTVVYWREAETAVDYDGETNYEYWGSETVGGTLTESGNLVLSGDVQSGAPIELSRYTEIPADIATTSDDLKLDESYFFHYNKEKTTAENPGTLTVAGDGTTVVNVYFDRNEYTLKFYYAAKDGNTNYVFGRTNPFGSESSAGNRNDEVALFDAAWRTSSWSFIKATVDDIPTVANSNNRYTVGADQSKADSDRFYYYFTFQAKYGADISKYWPTANDISSVGTTSTSLGNAIFSAWNGEYNVYYTKHKGDFGNNETIKGQYRRLDYRVLWDTALLDNSAVSEAYDNTVTYLAYWNNAVNQNYNIPSLYRYNIYLECLSQHGEDTTCEQCEENVPKAFAGKTYYRVAEYDVADNNDKSGTVNLQQQSHPDVYGFTNVNDANGTGLTQNEEYKVLTAGNGADQYDSDVYESGYEVYHFYDRNRYNLEFFNMGEKLQLKDANDNFFDKVTIRYGVSLYTPGGYDISNMTDPEGKSYYPDSLPKDAYEFEGWYTSPTFAPSTKFEFDETTTMPAHNMALYAHWVPKQFKVQIYKDFAALEEGKTLWSKTETDGTVRDYTLVSYGEHAPTPSEQYEHTTQENVQFAGWFYRDPDTNEEQAWNFESMPVTRDMQIYGLWIVNQVKTYTVNYVLLDENGNATQTQVADPLTGFELVGTNITLIAKAGDQLYPNYRKNFFLAGDASTSLKIDTNDDANTYTFYYKPAVSVPYTVRYVNEAGNPIAEDKNVSVNPYSIVTEVFQVIPNYLPDAYSKRLVVNADKPEDNVITFVYTENKEDAYYRVEHYVQAEAGDGYILYKESQAVAKINSTISVELLNMTGFTFKKEMTRVNEALNAAAYDSSTQKVSAMLTNQGLLFQLYYDRETMTYKVEYREYKLEGQGQELADAKTVTVRYGVSAAESGIDIKGYNLLTPPQTEIITDNDVTITFYYQERYAGVKYEAVGDGWLSLTSESILMKTGTAQGSVPTANGGYHFAGWYKNKACTIDVDETWVDAEDKITPKPAGEYFEETTYYALFERNTADLTISTDFPAYNNYRDADGSQTFVFRITGQGSNAAISLTITLHERESKTIADLPTGTYTVTELSGSAWRYTADNSSKNVEVRPNQNNSVSFLETRNQTLWLDGNAAQAVNIFTPVTNRKREGEN